MSSETFHGLLADLILIIHFAFVAFVVLGLVFIWVGFFCGLKSVRNFYFRIGHLLAMAIVVLQSVLGVICPLTSWENELRRLAGGEATYKTSFIQHWLHKILYQDWEPETFTIIYCAFFLALVLSLVFIRPRWPRWLCRTTTDRTG